MATRETDSPIAIGFPGQGVHEPERMQRLIRNFAVARDLIQEAEDVLHRPIFPLLMEPINASHTSRENQVRLYIGSCALFDTAEHEGIIPRGKRYIFGSSAGEIAAMRAADFYDFAPGLQLIDSRGEEMHGASIINEGGMLVASGLPFDHAEAIAMGIPGLEAVNDNPGAQSVFSGTKEAIEAAVELFMSSDKWSHVKIHYPDIIEAAHTFHMAPAVRGVKKAAKSIRMKRPRYRFMGNQAELLRSVRKARKHIPAQLTRSVLLRRSVDRLYDEYDVRTFVDVGQGKVLYQQLLRHFRSAEEPVKLISVVDTLIPEQKKKR